MAWSNDKNYKKPPDQDLTAKRFQQALEEHQQQCSAITVIFWNMKMRVMHSYSALRMKCAWYMSTTMMHSMMLN